MARYFPAIGSKRKMDLSAFRKEVS